MYLECEGKCLFTPFISAPTALSLFRHLVFLYLPFYIPFPQPFCTFNILAAELLVYCSQLLTVAEW